MKLGSLPQLACLMLAVTALSPALVQAESLWEFDPYKILVLVAAAPQPEMADPFTPQLLENLIAHCDAYIGAAWRVEARAASGSLAVRIQHNPQGVAHDHLPDGWRKLDKILLLRLRYFGGAYVVDIRGFDVLTEQWQNTVTRRIPQRHMLADETFRGLIAAFAPIAEIESADDKTAKLRWKAGALTCRDPSLVFVKPGMISRPFVRTTDREGNTRKVQPIDWTFLVAETNEAGSGTAAIYTGMRGILSGKRRGRVQPLALAICYEPGPTRLSLIARGNEPKPRALAGYDIYAYGPKDPKSELVGHTDRQGELAIPPAASPLRLLVIKNGNELLARFPIVPGLDPTATIRLADDGPRLAAEAFIVGLQERLVDVVVRRHVLIARIKLRISEGKLDEATKLMDELRRLDSQQEFLIALEQEQQKSLAGDPTVQRKIDRMFSDARKLVGQYLDPREVSRTEIDLDEARRAQVSQPPAATAN